MRRENHVPQQSTPTPDAEFARLLAPHLGSAVAYARALTENRHDAEDAVQEAVIKGLRSFAQFDQEKPFKPWWLVILRNTCKNRHRAHRRWINALTRFIGRTGDAGSTNEDLKKDVHSVLGRLPAQHREIIELKYLAECSYEEISGILGIPAGTVMSRLHAARKNFQRIYSGPAT
jgi:RNA polymerase sigma-70 factor (ECF subfamily)